MVIEAANWLAIFCWF